MVYTMVYTLEQVKQRVTDAAIKAEWINFAFQRRKYAVAVLTWFCKEV